MNKLNIILISAAALTFASSCRDEAELNPTEQDRAVTITAAPAQTKTVLDGGAVKWENGDQIALVFTHDTEAPAVRTFSTSIEGEPAAGADFTGTLPIEVYREGSGYHETVRAVYPHDAVSEDGGLVFSLPAEQKVRGNGTFAAGLNLASAEVSLEDIRDDGNASATFRNALSVLRFVFGGDDVTSVTLTGTSPLAGKAPFIYAESDGRLVIDTDASWSAGDKQMNVVLRPADGSECFAAGTVYNLLVLPGSHTELTAVVNFKEYGDYTKSKTFEVPYAFEPARYYGLDLNADSETLVREIEGLLEDVDSQLEGLESRLSALGSDIEKVEVLVDQIQSVALMTGYLDNAVYAPYAQMRNGRRNMDIELSYIVRPAAAAELLLAVCRDSDELSLSDVLSAMVDAKNGSLTSLTVKDAVLEGDLMTVTVDASGMPGGLYAGTSDVALALQISDGNTEILSDFANLVPRPSSIVDMVRTEDIPAMKGATMAVKYEYAVTDEDSYTITLNANGFASQPTTNPDRTFKQGYIYANFPADCDPSQMSIDVVVTSGSDVYTRTLTFADGGPFELSATEKVAYVGGEANVTVTRKSETYGNVTMELSDGGRSIVVEGSDPYDDTRSSYWYAWMYETYSGIQGGYTVVPNIRTVVEVDDPDSDNEPKDKLQIVVNEGTSDRSATVTVKVKPADVVANGDITYTRTLTITQQKEGSEIDETQYYQNGYYQLLNTADPQYATPLNLVILGDGYQKKDLIKGGKFERNARSAYDAFFKVAPFSDFRDRFKVYMVAYESVDEGLSMKDGNGNMVEQKNTYFKTWWQGGDKTYVNYADPQPINAVLRNTLGFDDKAFYRTVVILLVNTDANIGSTNYLSQTTGDVSVTGDGYATCSVAMVSAGTTGVGGLVRHEAGGHGFGRLGDEYAEYSVQTVNDKHNVGFYRNIATSTSYWSDFTNAGYGSDKVTYDRQYTDGVYRSTYQSGIMWNNNGNFNAVSRHLIYERIIKQTEGAAAYSWSKFLEYDKKNL